MLTKSGKTDRAASDRMGAQVTTLGFILPFDEEKACDERNAFTA
jgi:hypothetical protein